MNPAVSAVSRFATAACGAIRRLHSPLCLTMQLLVVGIALVIWPADAASRHAATPQPSESNCAIFMIAMRHRTPPRKKRSRPSSTRRNASGFGSGTRSSRSANDPRRNPARWRRSAPAPRCAWSRPRMFTVAEKCSRRSITVAAATSSAKTEAHSAYDLFEVTMMLPLV